MSFPSTNDEKKALKKFLEDGSEALTRVEAERDFIKNARAELSEESGLSKRILGRLLKVYHAGSFENESGDFSELKELFEAVVTP